MYIVVNALQLTFIKIF